MVFRIVFYELYIFSPILLRNYEQVPPNLDGQQIFRKTWSFPSLRVLNFIELPKIRNDLFFIVMIGAVTVAMLVGP